MIADCVDCRFRVQGAVSVREVALPFPLHIQLLLAVTFSRMLILVRNCRMSVALVAVIDQNRDLMSRHISYLVIFRSIFRCYRRHSFDTLIRT